MKAPTYGWNDVHHGQIGIIMAIDEDGTLDIDFDDFEGWGAHPADM